MILAAVLAAALLGAPAAALADPVIPDTWEGVMDIYGGAEVIALDFPVYASQGYNWADILSLDELNEFGDLELTPYLQDGAVISAEERPLSRPATGEHALVIDTEKQNYALFELVITGDVLGTGSLNIAQLVRMAQAVNGSAPLEGVYAQAGDLNGDGSISIADLVILGQWISGRYPREVTSPGQWITGALF